MMHVGEREEYRYSYDSDKLHAGIIPSSNQRERA